MAVFGKFIDAANTAFNRASQFTNEIRGAALKSTYPDDVIADFDIADKLRRVCDKLQSGITAWLNPNPADRMQDVVLEKFDAKKQPKLTSAELLGKLEQDLALELSQCSADGMLKVMLSQYGQVQMDIGTAERLLISEIQKSVLVTTKYYLDTVWPSINTQRRSLELARLDFDSARKKKESCTSEEKIRPLLAALEVAQTKYNEQIEATRQVTAQLKSVQESLQDGFKAMAAAQARYYTNLMAPSCNLEVDCTHYKTP
ncbi:Endophilin-B1 [Taenia crassiceps]|uniref:Endophilin-B1 n=1 Tax=Taenia crassiceps TaxID=6207 RepID=A0ABR4Q769_9CEST